MFHRLIERLSKYPRFANFHREIRVFNHLFPWRIALILLLGLVITTLLFQAAHEAWEGQHLSLVKSLFAVLNLTFFQVNYEELPTDDRMDIFAILVPLIGLPLFSFFGLQVINIIRIFFVRQERGQEWQEALVEATLSNHIVLCGLGRVGYRMAKILFFDYREPIVGITDTYTPLVDELIQSGMPVILGDASSEDALKRAGVERARVVVVCTNEDWVNLATVAHIRKLNLQARLVLRLFEDTMAEDIKGSFKIDTVLSRSAIAGTTFAYAALGIEVLQTFELTEQNYILVRLPLGSNSPLLGDRISQVAEEQDMTVVCHNRGQVLLIEPDPNIILEAGDTLFVFTNVLQLVTLVTYGTGTVTNKLTPPDRPVLVCGLGHTGYRVARYLHDLGTSVVGLDFEPGPISIRLEELGVPLKFGNMRWSKVLLEAGVTQAMTIVACTENDMANLQIALQARLINPKIRVVMRVFDETLSQQFQESFNIEAVYSTSALATPDFVSATLNQMHVRYVDMGGLLQAIIHIKMRVTGLYDLPIRDLNAEDGLTVLMHIRDGVVNIPPKTNTRLHVGDEIVVLATQDRLEDLNRRNRTLHDIMAEGYGH